MAAEQTNPVEVAEAVPPEQLGPWLARHVPGAGDAVEVTQIAGGSSNLTFRVRDGEHDGCCGARRSATCSPPRTTWDASTG